MQDWTLFLGDCTEQLQHIASDSVDLVVTSPPYTNQRSDYVWRGNAGRLRGVVSAHRR